MSYLYFFPLHADLDFCILKVTDPVMSSFYDLFIYIFTRPSLRTTGKLLTTTNHVIETLSPLT